jgi:tetratricopeptide (TPR) repeat protein
MRIAWFACACAAFALFGVAFAQDGAFRQDGLDYFGTATAQAATEQEALAAAKRAALRVIIDNLGYDDLFFELFVSELPFSVSFETVKSQSGGGSYRVTVTASVDETTLQILYSGEYARSVSNLVDGAELRLAAAERSERDGTAFERDGDFESALGSYWMAMDEAAAGVSLVAPIGESAIESTKGRTAADLRRALSSVKQAAQAGAERARTALAESEVDDAVREAVASIEAMLDDVVAARELLADYDSMLSSPASYDRAALEKARADLADAREVLAKDLELASRLAASMPEDRASTRNRLEFARTRLEAAYKAIGSALSIVEREINDPAIARAERDQFVKWIFFHDPSYIVSLRMNLPLGLAASARGGPTPVFLGLWDIILEAEGHVPIGDGGLWLQSSLEKTDLPLSMGTSGVDESSVALSQSIYLGFGSEFILGLGAKWDWVRYASGEAARNEFELRLFLSGLQSSGGRQSWFVAARYVFPRPNVADFALLNWVNLSLEGFARVGNVLEAEAALAYRLVEEDPSSGAYRAMFLYQAGVALRFPAPFLWGLQYSGWISSPLDGSPGDSFGSFRFYFEYAL